jgi:hypothetical protein
MADQASFGNEGVNNGSASCRFSMQFNILQKRTKKQP